MKQISEYVDDDVVRLLLQGPPGSGKTCLACQFPKPYIIDVDRNLGGTLRFIRDHKLTPPVGYDVLDRDEQDKIVEMPFRLNRLEALLTAALNNDAVETIILDSATTLIDVLIANCLRKQGKKEISDYKDGRQFWNVFSVEAKHFMAVLSTLRKHIVLIAHEKTQKNEKGDVIYPIKVAWPGQTGEIIGCFFTNVWRCETEKIAAGTQMNYRWNVRTLPDQKYELKNTLGVPALFEFKWDIVAAKLKPAV